MKLEQRFWSKVEKSPNGCWLWTASLTGPGYGQFWAKGQNVLAHRFAYEALVGPIPSGLELDHICHNDSDCAGGSHCPHRACVNPAHLEPVTHAVNSRRGRGQDSHNHLKTHCPKGHAYASGNLYIAPRGDRHCRICNREATRKRRAKELF